MTSMTSKSSMKAKKIPLTNKALHKTTKAQSLVGKTIQRANQVSISKSAIWSGDLSACSTINSLPPFPTPLVELQRHHSLWDLKKCLATACEPSTVPLLAFERWHSRCMLAQNSNNKLKVCLHIQI